MNPNTPAVTKRDIRTLLQSDAVKTQLAMVLPSHLTPERMARVACTAVLRTPKLAECSPESLLQALMLCSQAGLEPDGRNAHLIPYENRRLGTVEVQVIFDYKGLISLARRNGIQNISADVVCEGDVFEWSRSGDGLHFRHVVEWRKGRGEPFAAFCIWKDGEQFDGECMGRDEIEAIRNRSRAGNSGPWVTDWSEMAKKTVVRRASKKWPLDALAVSAVSASAEDDDAPQPKPAVVVPLMSIADAPAQTKVDAETGEPSQETLPPSTPPAKPATVSPQVTLGDFVLAEGFTFYDFRKWAVQSGNIDNAEDLTCFDDVSKADAQRIMRAKAGLKTQLAAVKGGLS